MPSPVVRDNQFLFNISGRFARGTVLLAGLLGFLETTRAEPVDYRLSTFGTVQYSISDNRDNYLRFVDDSGTFKLNTRAGVQADVNFNESLSGSLQLVAAPRTDRDTGTEIKPRWAWVGWKPNDDWLFKLGRQRLNFYLDSENLEVGHTYTPANLSPEIYFGPDLLSLDGLSAERLHSLDNETFLRLQAITGTNRTDSRNALPDGRINFARSENRISGISVSVEQPDTRWQMAHHVADLSTRRFVQLGAPDPTLAEGLIAARYTSAGFEHRFYPWTLRGEASLAKVRGSIVGRSNPVDGVELSRISTYREKAANLVLSRQLSDSVIGYLSQGRFLSEFDDQYSTAIGFKWNLSVHDSIKAEWMAVEQKNPRPDLSDSRDPSESLNLLSVSYNWVF